MLNSYQNFLRFILSLGKEIAPAFLTSLHGNCAETYARSRGTALDSESVNLTNQVRDTLGIGSGWSIDGLHKLFCASQDHLPDIYLAHASGQLKLAAPPLAMSMPVASIDIGQIIQALIAAGQAAPQLIADIQVAVAAIEALIADVESLVPGSATPPAPLRATAAMEAHDDRIAALCHVCEEHTPPELRGSVAAIGAGSVTALVRWLIAHPQFAMEVWQIIQGLIAKPQPTPAA